MLQCGKMLMYQPKTSVLPWAIIFLIAAVALLLVWLLFPG
jgi:hypothetical protein